LSSHKSSLDLILKHDDVFFIVCLQLTAVLWFRNI